MAHSSEQFSLMAKINELVKNHGFPTYAEFCKNPDKWRKNPDALLESADGSTHVFRNLVKRQRYQWKDNPKAIYKTLEEMQRLMADEGYRQEDLVFLPFVRPLDGSSKTGAMEIVLQFWPKIAYELQRGVTVHD